MDNAVIEYKKRRQARLDKNNPARMDAVDAFRSRREKRVLARFDASTRLAYGIAKSMGINTEGMEPKEVWEAIMKEDPGAAKEAMKGYGNRKPKGNVSGKSEERSKKGKDLGSANRKSVVKNHEYDGSGYDGEPGEVKSGKSGNLKPKSESAKKIDCGDAVGETDLWKSSNHEKGREKNSLTGHVDENGNLIPERQKVHDEIVQQFFKDKIPQEGQATMTMSGGGPASGKSFIKRGIEERFGKETTITVDPDEIKEFLPGYTDMAVATDDAAGHYHEESSALAKRIYQYAVDNNLNVVYDGTGDGSVNSVKKKIKTARDGGYKVNGEYVTVDIDGPNGAIARNEKRYQNGKEKFKSGKSDVPPRKPKEWHLRKIHSDVSDIVPDVFGLFDNFKLFDNNVSEGEKPVLVATSKIGEGIKIESGQDEKLAKFLGKGVRGWRFSNGKFEV